MKNQYPTNKELKEISNWDILEKGVIGLLNLIEELWWCNSTGFILKGKRKLKLELHTWGWSGNEDIINVLQKIMFWFMFWRKSIRGGHYYFKIDLKLFEKVNKNETTKA